MERPQRPRRGAVLGRVTAPVRALIAGRTTRWQKIKTVVGAERERAERLTSMLTQLRCFARPAFG